LGTDADGAGNLRRTEAIYVAEFQHDGRGPELQEVHWKARGTQLVAIDYYNPADDYTAASLKHVRFSALQVVMITPEEVMGSSFRVAPVVLTATPRSMQALPATVLR
jgi:hypothetical protein